MTNTSNRNKIAFLTLGCKLNYTESGSIGDLAEQNGFKKVKITENPDIVVINTCSVTQNADSKCRQAIKKACKSSSTKPIIVITGCYAQLKPELFKDIEGVDLVLGNNEKFDLINQVKQISSHKTLIAVSDINKESSFISSYSSGERTRSFLKIQDGCNYFCSYCTIPFARGRSRSDSIANVLTNVKNIASSGIKEIVLTGINIGHFGDNHNETLYELIQQLEKTEGIERFRISSIEPNLITDEIIEFIASSKKFLPHFHIPLQSGCDKILKAMNRKYSRNLFENRIYKILSLMPNACIATDIIAGFPSETSEDFEDTFEFLKSLPIAYMHVFTYSERPDTKALNINPTVPNNERKVRSERLHALSEEKKHQFYLQNENTLHSVLFESQNKKGVIYGFTENYIKVKTEYSKTLINQIKNIKLKNLEFDDIYNIEFCN